MSKEITRKHLIFQSRIADDLVELGENMLYVRPDLKDSTKSVFIFADSPTFNENKVSVLKKYGYLK